MASLNERTRKVDQEDEMEAGSLEAIIYAFFQFIDEIFHAVGLDGFRFGYRFCQWVHRKD